MLLPGYEDYRRKMNNRIKRAKRNGDREAVKRMKKQMRSHRVSRLSDKSKDIIAHTLCAVPIVLFAVYLLFGKRLGI